MSIINRLLNRKSPDEIPTITLSEFQEIIEKSCDFIDLFGTEAQVAKGHEIMEALVVADKAADPEAFMVAWNHWNDLNTEVLTDNDMGELLEVVGEGLVRVMDPSNN